jgi:hypothetical protein
MDALAMQKHLKVLTFRDIYVQCVPDFVDCIRPHFAVGCSTYFDKNGAQRV